MSVEYFDESARNNPSRLLTTIVLALVISYRETCLPWMQLIVPHEAIRAGTIVHQRT